MIRTFPILFFSVVCVALADTPAEKYWIYFSSKEDASVLRLPAEESAKFLNITERAVERRRKMSAVPVGVDDLPVSATFIARLSELGIRIERRSRWFNAVSAYLTESQRQSVQSLPFVRSILPVTRYSRTDLPVLKDHTAVIPKHSAANKYSYGPSEAQMTMINAIAVHNIGVSGRGVLVGMLDTGFRWKNHEALQQLNVVSEYDFIQNDNSTENDGVNDAASQDNHGTSTMSLVGGFKEGQLVSPAFNASFLLGKTEYVPSETNVEEDNWVEAIEWMESQGVDVISSSLGYKQFDAGQKSYVYADMNGRTATTSKAATIAARKGVVVVTSMGNEGANFTPPSIVSPADADSILSVGAVNGQGNLALFSSTGPTADGRIKPDVVAHGVGTYIAVPATKVNPYSGASQGTSLSTPLVAGTAAMILSARPDLTPMQVRDALRTTASNAASPNSSIGWGIINAYNALLHHGMVIGTDPEISLTQDSNYSVAIFVLSNAGVNKDSVRLHYTTDNGGTFTTLPMTLTETINASTSSGKYTVVVPKSVTTPKFYVRAVDVSQNPRTGPFNAPANLYDMKTGTTGIPPGNPVPSEYVIRQNFPNPFNPVTTISYGLPRASEVRLTVFDVLGRHVATLVDGVQQFGNYAVPFDGTRLSSGTYFYRLEAGKFVETKRMMLVK